MKVKFRNRFFGPDGNRYKPEVEHEVPDSWKDQLPSSATIITAEQAVSKPVEVKPSAAAGTATKGAKL